MNGTKVLVIDDEPGVRSALEGVLGDEGYRVVVADSGEAGLEAVEGDAFDAILLDIWLPGIDGLETLTRIRRLDADASVVMISGHGTIETAVRATKLGAFDFVEKPLSLDRTLLVLRNALRQRRLERANRRLMAQLQADTEVLGESDASSALRGQVEVAASSESPVLIVGPQGSGRENLARRIQRSGARADAAFVEVPFGAMDAARAATVLEGAGEDGGRLELAAGGTLFLEDVDRLDAAAQRRLSALLVDRARRPRAPRVLASTASPEALDAELRQALDVIRLEIPPLSARPQDVAPLAERFLREFAREYGRPAKKLSARALERLADYAWPGEVRELRNLTEQLVLFHEGEQVDVDDLPEAVRENRATPAAADLYGRFSSLETGVEAFRRFHVRRAVEEAEGDRAAAAERLGISVADVTRWSG